MIGEVQKYVPGYTLKNGPVFDGKRVSTYLEVAGPGRLPAQLRRQPRHHDRGGAAHRRADRRGDVRPARFARRRRGPHEPVAASRVTLHDMSLRDGMHPKRHQITLEQMVAVATGARRRRRAAHRGHARRWPGRRLGQLRLPRAQRRGVPARGGPAAEARQGLGAAAAGHRHRRAPAAWRYDCGVGTIRVATHCTEADVSEQHIGARAQARARHGRLPDDGAHDRRRRSSRSRRKLMESYGANCVYCTDSAGYMLPDDVTRAHQRAARGAQARDRDRLSRPPQPGHGHRQLARRHRGGRHAHRRLGGGPRRRRRQHAARGVRRGARPHGRRAPASISSSSWTSPRTSWCR